MATDTFINITDLQSITEIGDGDYLIVETPAGTRIIDFKDFIIPNTNILLSSTVSDNTIAIIQNKSTSDAAIASLNASVSEISGNSLSQARSNLLFIESVSASLDSKINKFFISKTQVTIGINNATKDFVITPTYTLQLETKDISITPSNAYAAVNNAYVSNISYNQTTNANTITITAPFSGSPAIATQDAIYNIMIVCN